MGKIAGYRNQNSRKFLNSKRLISLMINLIDFKSNTDTASPHAYLLGVSLKAFRPGMSCLELGTEPIVDRSRSKQIAKHQRTNTRLKIWAGYDLDIAGVSPDDVPQSQALAQHQLGTVLQRLSQMHRLNFLTSRQICNGTRQFEDTMISSCR